MFEDKTYESILAEALAKAPAGVDTRQGSIYYDAVAGACFVIANYYADLSTIFDLVFITTSADEYLDRNGMEARVPRLAATPAKYEFLYTGGRPPNGERFFNAGKYFVLGRENGMSILTAEIPGSDSNDILPGAPAVPLNNLSGLISSAFGELIIPGTDTETDMAYLRRIQEKIANRGENGNLQHYKSWCEEIEGVGRARIVPLWQGDNTVLGVIFSVDGTPAMSTVVEKVQEYIDPGSTGTGLGVANIGAYFTAQAAEALPVDISFTVTLASGATVEDAIAEATDALTAHFKDLTLNTPDLTPLIIRVSTVGAIIHNLPSVLDYADLTFNGSGSNIELDPIQAPVLQEVIVSETV